jgi:hypothetical protein
MAMFVYQRVYDINGDLGFSMPMVSVALGMATGDAWSSRTVLRVSAFEM